MRGLTMKKAIRAYLIPALIFFFFYSYFAVPKSLAVVYRILAAPEKDRVILRWSLPLEGNLPDGFVVERRKDGEKEWERLTEKPILRVKDREKVKDILGEEQFGRVEPLLFPKPPDFTKEKRAIKEERTRRSLLLLMADIDPRLADALAIRFVDTGVSKGERYFYRILEVWKGELLGVVAQTARSVGLNDYRPLPPVTEVKGVPGDKSAYFRWIPDRIFSAYDVLRADSPTGEFKKVNEGPVIIPVMGEREGPRMPKYFFVDRNLENGKKYYYRVRGIDSFGRVSPLSASVEVVPADYTPPLAPVGLDSEVENDTVILRWKDSPEEDLAGYHVYRAVSRKGPFKRLTRTPLGKGENLFVDDGLPINSSYWYRVTAVDESGNESGPSVPVYVKVLDKIPPAVPSSLTAKTEPGKVLLTWVGGGESDLRGFKIFRSTDKDTKEFQLVNREPVREAKFVDVLPKNMSEITIYYRVKAVDYSYNESAFSDVVEARLPDVTPPDVPQIKDFSVEEKKITIFWFKNTEPDLAGYDLFRVEKGKESDAKIKVNDELIPPESDSYTDVNGLKPGVKYSYTLVAVDDDGNASKPSRSVVVSTFDATPPPSPTSIKARFDGKEKTVVVSWDNPDVSDLMGVVLLRAKREGGPFFPQTKIIHEESYRDFRVKPGKTYFYRLIAFDESNNRSEPSKVISVTVPVSYE